MLKFKMRQSFMRFRNRKKVSNFITMGVFCLGKMQNWSLTFAIISGAVTSFFPSSTFSYAATEPAKSWRFTCYAFRDVNRNGIFDLGDRPFAEMRIEMTRPNGSVYSSKSNINGFTPFIVSLENKKNAAVRASGTYKIKAKAPEGFTFTAPLDRQSVEFIGQANARGKLIPRELCTPIGVAPVLTISGRLISSSINGLSNYQVLAFSDDEKKYKINLDESGAFSLNGNNGKWRIEVRNLNDEILYNRAFTVSGLPVRLSTIKLTGNHNNPSDGKIVNLNFDDLLISDTLFEIPSGYGGLSWVNWIATHNQFYRGPGYVNLTTSSEYMAYNSSGMPGQTHSEEPFDFIGTNVGVAWPRGMEEDVIFKAWTDEKLLYEDYVSPSNKTAVFFDAAYYGITRLEIKSGNYERVVIDDFKFRQ